MKTLTELSGILIRKAAEAVAVAQRSLPRQAAPGAVEAPAQAAPIPGATAPAAPAPDVEAGAPGEQAGAAGAAADQAGASGGTETQAEAPEATAGASPAQAAEAPQPEGPPVEEAETEAVKAALDAAVSAATGVSGDRLARLRDAVKVAGRQVEDVRLVRVFGPEEPIPGAKALGGYQYLVDVAPASMRQVGAPPRKERFGRGGGDRGHGGGGKGAPASGGFSMDSLKEDRRGQRSGPGVRGKPGGVKR
jgi:translation initiation factor IF-2